MTDRNASAICVNKTDTTMIPQGRAAPLLGGVNCSQSVHQTWRLGCCCWSQPMTDDYWMMTRNDRHHYDSLTRCCRPLSPSPYRRSWSRW